MDWRIEKQKTLATTPVLSLEEVFLADKTDHTPLGHPYYRIAAPSWVNVFALTKEQRAILVRQPRVGMMQMTLEVPGGGIEPNEDPSLAATRELEEETGFRAERLDSLGVISPNPAIMTNRLHMFLARNCYRPETRQYFPDSAERIQVLELPLAELDALVQAGGIHNALAALTILMARRYLLRD